VDFAERNRCKPGLLRLSLAGNLEKPLFCPSMEPNGGSVAMNSFAGLSKLDFAERDRCKPVLLRLSLVRNLEKPLLSLNGIEWRGNVAMDSEQ
jgi:hypothetical protein